MKKVKIDEEDGLARASAFTTLNTSLDEGTYQDYTTYGRIGNPELNDLIDYYNDELNANPLYKKSSGKTTRDKSGNIIYRGQKFPAYNKPIKDSGKKQGKVLVKEGSRIGIVRFGDPKLRDNYSVEANDRFYARFGGQKGMNDKFSPLYWSARWLWARGSMKGKGAKPFATLKKSEVDGEVKETEALSNLLQSLLSALKPTSPQKEIIKEDDDDDDDLDDDIDEEDEQDDEFEEELDSEDEDDDEDDDDDDDEGGVEKLISIVKQFDEEQMVAIEPLYINVGDADAHGDGISDEELDKLIDNFNANIDNIQGNIHHAEMTDGFKPIKAYRLPMDVMVGDPKDPDSLIKIPEGQPIVKVQFSKTDLGKRLWEKRKSGTLMGVSIGAKGSRVPNPDYIGED